MIRNANRYYFDPDHSQYIRPDGQYVLASDYDAVVAERDRIAVDLVMAEIKLNEANVFLAEAKNVLAISVLISRSNALIAEARHFLADEKVLRRHVEGRVKELEAFIRSHDTQWFKCSECGDWNMRTTLLSILPPTQELL